MRTSSNYALRLPPSLKRAIEEPRRWHDAESRCRERRQLSSRPCPVQHWSMTTCGDKRRLGRASLSFALISSPIFLCAEEGVAIFAPALLFAPLRPEPEHANGTMLPSFSIRSLAANGGERLEGAWASISARHCA